MFAIEKLHFEVLSMLSEAALRLRLTSVTFGTAASLYHRVFKVVAVEAVCPHTVAMACLSLACKVEEEHQQLRDIINVCYCVLHHTIKPLQSNETFSALRTSLVTCELFVMRVLQFRVRHGQRPFTYLTYYLNAINQWLPRNSAQVARLPTLAWSLFRDSYYGAVCVEVTPQHLALAVLRLALQLIGLKFPGAHLMKSEDGWTKAFVENLNSEELDPVIHCLLDLYDLDDEMQRCRGAAAVAAAGGGSGGGDF